MAPDMSIQVTDFVPHQGAMCLLDCVEHWSEDRIVCRATTHRNPDHPLRDRLGLRGTCAIEYGAQAIAAHAGLVGASRGSQPAVGYLVSIRDVVVLVARLDDIETSLTICAGVLLRTETGQIYELAVTAGDQIVLTGRISIIVPRTVDDPRLAASLPESAG